MAWTGMQEAQKGKWWYIWICEQRQKRGAGAGCWVLQVARKKWKQDSGGSSHGVGMVGERTDKAVVAVKRRLAIASDWAGE